MIEASGANRFESHRGEIVDKLLDGHDHMRETPEGRVFHGFHRLDQSQIARSATRTKLKS
jgi:hypothetical protein